MKKKSKLDPKAMKQFFIDHTEKIVIGVVGLLFLYFTYSAVMLQTNDSYKNEPKKLDDLAQAAETTMKNGPTGKTVVAEAPITSYAKYIEQFKEPLEIKRYPAGPPWDLIVIGQRNPRGTPAVIPVEELRAVAGRGALGSKDNNASTVGQRWVVVTGLVPYAKQLAEYRSNFESANFEGEHDLPEYAGFLVQRAEVAPGTTGEPNWEKAVTVCNVSFLGRQSEKWSGAAAEVVDAKSIYPGLTSQLPPRAVGEWGDEAAHPSEIKILTQEERDQLQGGGQAGQFPANQPGRGGERGGRQFPPQRRVDGAFGRNRGGASIPGRRPLPVAPGAGGDQSGDDLFGGNDGAKQDAANNKSADEAAEIPPYYLLRYFDFDVEQGKQYAYRVYLLLRNPNEGVPENVLREPQQRNQHYLSVIPGKERANEKNQVGDLQIGPYWSNACQTTRLPGNMRLIAGPVAEPPKSSGPTEITGEVHILRWDEASGANTNASQSGLYRGTVLNFDDIAVHTPGEQSPTHEKVYTDSILADMTGGEALMPRLRDSIHGPGAMLFLDEAGNLVIGEEMSQLKEWIAETKEPDRPKNIVSRERGMPERRLPHMRDRGGPPRGGLSATPDSSLPDMAPRR